METKVEQLAALRNGDNLEGLISGYIRRCQQQAPENLIGLGSATVYLSAAGYTLRLPAVPMVGNVTQTDFAASLSRLLEDGQMDTGNDDWLRIEIKTAADHHRCLAKSLSGRGIVSLVAITTSLRSFFFSTLITPDSTFLHTHLGIVVDIVRRISMIV